MQSLDRIREIEADKPAAPEAPAPVYEAPKFTAPLAVQGAIEEAGSAHLQAQFTPIDDPNLKVGIGSAREARLWLCGRQNILVVNMACMRGRERTRPMEIWCGSVQFLTRFHLAA